MLKEEKDKLDKESVEDILKEVDEDADLPELEGDDLLLPPSYDIEVLAGKALECMQTIRVVDVSRRGVESAGDTAGAKKMLEARVAAEGTLRRIKRDCPKALKVAKEIATAQAQGLRETRKSMLDRDGA